MNRRLAIAAVFGAMVAGLLPILFSKNKIHIGADIIPKASESASLFDYKKWPEAREAKIVIEVFDKGVIKKEIGGVMLADFFAAGAVVRLADVETIEPSPVILDNFVLDNSTTAPVVDNASSTALAVIINEVAWMGNATSTADEWIELYNNSSSTVSLFGWTLAAKDGAPFIALFGSILNRGYFLLERTDDDSVPKVSANQIYIDALENEGEFLELKDASGKLIDFVDASSGWPAGDNSTKQTMERRDDMRWQTSALFGGTPKVENSALP